MGSNETLQEEQFFPFSVKLITGQELTGLDNQKKKEIQGQRLDPIILETEYKLNSLHTIFVIVEVYSLGSKIRAVL